MNISSRTPEGEPTRCPVCHAVVCMEPSQPAGDAPCPNCGHLLWFNATSSGIRLYDALEIAPIRDRLLGLFMLAGRSESIFPTPPDLDSFDIVELIMEIEEEFDVTIPDTEAEQVKTVGDAIDLLY